MLDQGWKVEPAHKILRGDVGEPLGLEAEALKEISGLSANFLQRPPDLLYAL